MMIQVEEGFIWQFCMLFRKYDDLKKEDNKTFRVKKRITDMKKPLIGITCWVEEKENLKRKYPIIYPYDYLARNYYFAVEQCGGVPVLLPNLSNLNLIDDVLNSVKGLVVSGGYDVHPKYYGEKKIHRSVRLTPDRDRFEMTLVKKARTRKIPILGICRGHQLINVAFGGTLYQDFRLKKDIPNHRTGKVKYRRRKHKVLINENSKLYAIIKRKEIEVNTSHHQIIRNIAPGFLATAWSKKDGVIEGLESSKDRYLVSVQWHPEIDHKKESSKKLFSSLIQAAISK